MNISANKNTSPNGGSSRVSNSSSPRLGQLINISTSLDRSDSSIGREGKRSPFLGRQEESNISASLLSNTKFEANVSQLYSCNFRYLSCLSLQDTDTHSAICLSTFTSASNSKEQQEITLNYTIRNKSNKNSFDCSAKVILNVDRSSPPEMREALPDGYRVREGILSFTDNGPLENFVGGASVTVGLGKLSFISLYMIIVASHIMLLN